jgi:hypothetical protein
MDRALVEQHLAEAEQHVELGKAHLRGQKKVISKLERGGHDTLEAHRLLNELEQMRSA